MTRFLLIRELGVQSSGVLRNSDQPEVDKMQSIIRPKWTVKFSIKQLGLLLFTTFLLSMFYLFEYWHTVNLIFKYYDEIQKFNQIRNTVDKLRVEEVALASVTRFYKFLENE